jgi:hypothetical protein
MRSKFSKGLDNLSGTHSAVVVPLIGDIVDGLRSSRRGLKHLPIECDPDQAIPQRSTRPDVGNS